MRQDRPIVEVACKHCDGTGRRKVFGPRPRTLPERTRCVVCDASFSAEQLAVSTVRLYCSSLCRLLRSREALEGYVATLKAEDVLHMRAGWGHVYLLCLRCNSRFYTTVALANGIRRHRRTECGVPVNLDPEVEL